LRTALSVAVEEKGKPAVDELIDAIPKTTDPVKRNAMLGGLSHAKGAEADVVRNFALSPQVKVGEMSMLLHGDRDTVAERDGLWNWFTAHYDKIVARTGVFSGGYLPMIAASGSCSDPEAQRVHAYFEPKLSQVPGLKRGLAQTHESIVLCGALKAHQNPASIAQ
ncbi:MAG TPA: ERAP1-like C-terminal domain-containing protein, partial [Rhodanobacteraceae bacterium]|nr:ERAP1-like C-terminal domain-containing protein [Rhodanobacteraceae bacterium]